MSNKKVKPYFDEQSQKWLIDDCGRPREATEAEIQAYLSEADK